MMMILHNLIKMFYFMAHKANTYYCLYFGLTKIEYGTQVFFLHLSKDLLAMQRPEAPLKKLWTVAKCEKVSVKAFGEKRCNSLSAVAEL